MSEGPETVEIGNEFKSPIGGDGPLEVPTTFPSVGDIVEYETVSEQIPLPFDVDRIYVQRGRVVAERYVTTDLREDEKTRGMYIIALYNDLTDMWRVRWSPGTLPENGPRPGKTKWRRSPESWE